MITVLRLSQIQDRIHRALVLNFSEPVWIRAEIAQSKLNRGHYYLQLVEKAEGSDERIAQVDAVLWSSRSRGFPDILKQELPKMLEDGMEVQVLVRVDYHAIYGLKLTVEDIDLTVAQGQMAVRRQQIINDLQELGLFDRNRSLPFPNVIQRVAVLTSLHAAGWQDFREQLVSNMYGFDYHLEVFPASMQGGAVEQEVLQQLSAIQERASEFDVCVLIRGGGSKLDLAWFDNKSIGVAIAESDIPVLTGIGHDIDETVSDLVAARALKTPTAVATFLIETNMVFDASLVYMHQQITQMIQRAIHLADSKIDKSVLSLRHATQHAFDKSTWDLQQTTKDIRSHLVQRMKDQHLALDQMAIQIGQLDPDAILSRGYSMTIYQDLPVRDPTKIPLGTRILTYVEKGLLISKTISDEQEENEL